MWLGFSVAAMTEGVSRTCGISVSVCGSSLVFHWAKSAHDFFYSAITETVQWSHPDIQCDLPPPCRRAHSTTHVRREIIIVGGGEDASYCNSACGFDIPTRRWSCMTFTTRCSAVAPHAHHSVLLEQNPCAERPLDF